MPAPLALAIEAPALPAAGDLEASCTDPLVRAAASGDPNSDDVAAANIDAVLRLPGSRTQAWTQSQQSRGPAVTAQVTATLIELLARRLPPRSVRSPELAVRRRLRAPDKQRNKYANGCA
jgi:hypothetical protein